MNLEEIWKDIIGYEGFYQVSNLGRVKGLQRMVKGRVGNTVIKKEKLLKSFFCSSGYPRVQLCKNGNTKFHSIHRLIAETFIPNPDNKPQVNHINGIKEDNRLENLEWITVSGNSIHAVKLGLITMNHIKRKVIDIKSGKVYESITSAAKDYGYSVSHTQNMLVGKKKNKTNLKYI